MLWIQRVVLVLRRVVPVLLFVAIALLGSPVRAADSCRRLPENKRLKLNLKPNTELVDLITWISAITCKQFVVPGSISSQSKTVTIIAPRLITPAEAYQVFLDALDSVGLTVYPTGNILRVIETSRVKSAPLPLYVDEPG